MEALGTGSGPQLARGEQSSKEQAGLVFSPPLSPLDVQFCKSVGSKEIASGQEGVECRSSELSSPGAVGAASQVPK